jgi:DNA-binding beta-propeller fold protein YncE
MNKISYVLFVFLISCYANSSIGQTIKKTGPALEQLWSSDTLFRTPESVIYDKVDHVFYVSNVNLKPWEKDGNGFISILDRKGKIKKLKWVEGFNGPKGMGIIKRSLFVADLDQIVEISIESGKIINRFHFEENSALNDITVADDGSVYVSDSDNGRIFRLKDGTSSLFLEADLKRPNGLFAEKNRLLLVTSKGQQFISIDYKTKELTVLADSLGSGDGVKPVGNGAYLVSNWLGELYYITGDMKKIKLIDIQEKKINCADIEYLEDEKLLLIPTFFNNRVIAYKLLK